MLEEITKVVEEVDLKKKKKGDGVHFVLVHGICHGGWCWYKIRCLMENSGHKVTCVDLKGGGVDTSDVNTVLAFDDYNKPLLDLLSSLPQDEQVVLVGHSAGGISVTHALLKFPAKIRVAVYVAATMLKDGFASDQDVKDGVPDLSEYGDVYELGFGLGPDQPPTSALFKNEFQRKILYHMSPQEDSTLAAMLLRPCPIQAMTTARFKQDGVDGENDVDKVPRVYVKALQDRALKPEQQDTMIKRWPPAEVYELDSDHCPFFCQPFLLFGILVKAATSHH